MKLKIMAAALALHSRLRRQYGIFSRRGGTVRLCGIRLRRRRSAYLFTNMRRFRDDLEIFTDNRLWKAWFGERKDESKADLASAFAFFEKILQKSLPNLDKRSAILYNNKAIGVWHSLVVCLVRDQEAAGSSPATPTKKIRSAYAGRIFFCLHFWTKFLYRKKHFFAQLSRKRKMHNIETKVLYEKFLVFLQ